MEDGDLLFWLPAMVTRHAESEDGAVIGYAVRMLDSDDTFTQVGHGQGDDDDDDDEAHARTHRPLAQEGEQK